MNFDIIIRNGRVIDGTGNPWIKEDVAISDGRIAKFGCCSADSARQEIEAEGLAVCPGFIDIHQHGEISVLINPECDSLIRQGVTTFLGGQCGWSAAPISEKNRHLVHSPWWPKEVEPSWETFDEFFNVYESQGVAVNVANLVGHGWVRSAVMGWEARPPTEREMEQMKTHVERAMKDGAFGFSSGLTYPPGCWADADEVNELAAVAGEYGGMYATHCRGGEWSDAKGEAIRTGRMAGVPVQISHIETHEGEWGHQEDVLSLVEQARNEGIDITYDVCTTLYGGGWLATYLPSWAYEGGTLEMLSRVQDPGARDRMRKDIMAHEHEWEGIIVLWTRAHPEFMGMNVAEISEKWNRDPIDTLFDLLKDEGPDLAEIECAMKGHVHEELEYTFAKPFAMPISDSWFYTPTGFLGKRAPHPRGYGGFPLVFRKWVRGDDNPDMPEEPGRKLATLEEAVRKMTSLPANRLKLRDRGILREGMCADIVVFDPADVSEKAVYPGAKNRKPHAYPTGIPYVLVNGTVVIDNGEHTGALPGKVLRGPGYETR